MGKTFKINASNIEIRDGTERRSINTGTIDAIHKLAEIVDKNLECGLLLDWDIKVKDTELARKMYPDHCIRKGWLYAKKV